MPGLLDFANTDDGMQGLGLLAAAAPSMAPMNLAGRLAQAAQGYGGLKDAAIKRQEAQQVFQMKNIALQQQQQEWAMQLPLLQGWAARMQARLSAGQAPQGMPAPQDAPQVAPTMPFSDGPRDMLSGLPPPPSAPQPMQAPQALQAQQAQQAQQGQGGSMFPNVPDDVAFAVGGLKGMRALPDVITKYNEPTEMQKNNNYLGISTSEAATAARRKMAGEGLMNLKPDGTVYDPVTGPQFTAPDPKTGSQITWQNGRPSVSQMAGAGGVISAVAEQSKTGANRATPEIGYDSVTGLPVNQTADQRVQSATGRATNNPGNLRPQGASTGFQSFATPEAGLAALDGNLKSYGSKGINTISGVISRWAPPNENNTAAYVADVSKRLGIAPDAKIDLSNAVVRQALSTAITIHENGSRILTGGSQPSQSTVLPAQPAGFTANANVAQEASAKTMHDSYAKLQSGNSTANASLDAIDKLMKLGANKSVLQAGPLGTYPTAIMPGAAEYEKGRANLIAQIANQNGTNGSDAGRALTGQSVPDYGKPKDAIASGLQTLRNQTVANQLKTNFLTPIYQEGDSKKYTALENQFDQNVSPAIVPLLTMPAGQSRALLLKNAVKDPAMKAKLNWAAENGLLK